MDVAAPGVSIYSTYPPASYKYLSGTSMATPQVSGLAGLLASQGKTNSQIRSAIETTAVDLGRVGKDQFYGNGRINAQAAVSNDGDGEDGDSGHSKQWFNKRLNELQNQLHHTRDAGKRRHIIRQIHKLRDDLRALQSQ